MSGPGARSFDHPRERPAPATAAGEFLDGSPIVLTFDRPTLVVAVKANCDGCRDFVGGSLVEFAGLTVVVVSADRQGEADWAQAPRPIVVAPDLLAELEVRWSPFYVLIDPLGPRVVAEGVVYSASQVAAEIASRRA